MFFSQGTQEVPTGIFGTTTEVKRALDVSDISDVEVDLRGEASAPGSIGSNEPVDTLRKDLLGTEHRRANGYIGKTSEVQWLQQLEAQIDRSGDAGETSSSFASSSEGQVKRQGSMSRSRARGPLGGSEDFTYNLDDTADIVFEHVDPFELPVQYVAEALVHSYIQSVHENFPLLAISTFVRQFNHLFSGSIGASKLNLSVKWRVMLNLVLAIGAKYSHKIRAPWRADSRDHTIYVSRARLLGLNGEPIVTHSDEEQIQILGLLTIYYMAIHNVSRYVKRADRDAVVIALH
jgi:hypothetical protein